MHTYTSTYTHAHIHTSKHSLTHLYIISTFIFMHPHAQLAHTHILTHTTHVIMHTLIKHNIIMDTLNILMHTYLIYTWTYTHTHAYIKHTNNYYTTHANITHTIYNIQRKREGETYPCREKLGHGGCSWRSLMTDTLIAEAAEEVGCSKRLSSSLFGLRHAGSGEHDHDKGRGWEMVTPMVKEVDMPIGVCCGWCVRISGLGSGAELGWGRARCWFGLWRGYRGSGSRKPWKARWWTWALGGEGKARWKRGRAELGHKAWAAADADQEEEKEIGAMMGGVSGCGEGREEEGDYWLGLGLIDD